MGKNEVMKVQERGVTLVVLTITIIVLLILVGVSINGIFGESGLISNAENAKKKAKIENEKEIIESANILAEMRSKTGQITVEEMQKAMDETTRRRKNNSYKQWG